MTFQFFIRSGLCTPLTLAFPAFECAFLFLHNKRMYRTQWPQVSVVLPQGKHLQIRRTMQLQYHFTTYSLLQMSKTTHQFVQLQLGNPYRNGETDASEDKTAIFSILFPPGQPKQRRHFGWGQQIPFLIYIIIPQKHKGKEVKKSQSRA